MGLLGRARTAETYLAGFGASGALVAGTIITFMLMLGLISFSGFPSGNLFAGDDSQLSAGGGAGATPAAADPPASPLPVTGPSEASGGGGDAALGGGETKPGGSGGIGDGSGGAGNGKGVSKPDQVGGGTVEGTPGAVVGPAGGTSDKDAAKEQKAADKAAAKEQKAVDKAAAKAERTADKPAAKVQGTAGDTADKADKALKGQRGK